MTYPKEYWKEQVINLLNKKKVIERKAIFTIKDDGDKFVEPSNLDLAIKELVDEGKIEVKEDSNKEYLYLV